MRESVIILKHSYTSHCSHDIPETKPQTLFMWTINALTISSKVLDSFLVGFNTRDSEVFLCIIPLLICHTIFGSWPIKPISLWSTVFPADFWTFLILILSLPRVYFSHDPVSPTNLPSSDLLQNGGRPPPRPMPGACNTQSPQHQPCKLVLPRCHQPNLLHANISEQI